MSSFGRSPLSGSCRTPRSVSSSRSNSQVPGTLPRDRWMAVQAKEYVLIRVEELRARNVVAVLVERASDLIREHDRPAITATQMRDGILKPGERSVPREEMPTGPERPD